MKDWMKPMRSAPSTAPVRLPIPPSTAAVKAMSPSWKPLSNRTWYSRKNTRPATAASDPARKKVTEIVRLTSMPIIADASVSWATARIAFPCRVELTNQLRTTSVGTMIASAITSFQLNLMSPIENAVPCGMSSDPLS